MTVALHRGMLVAALLVAPLLVARAALADHPSGGGGGGDKPPAPGGGADKPPAPSGGTEKPAVGSTDASDHDHADHDHPEAPEVPVFNRGAVAATIHALPAVTGFYGVGGDVALNSWLAVGAVAQYYRRDREASWSGAGAEIGAHLFVVGTVYRGLYLAPRVALHSLGSDDPRTGGRRLVPAVAATVGLQWAAAFGLTVRIGIGVVVRRGRVDGDLASVTVPFDGAALATDGAVGWVF